MVFEPNCLKRSHYGEKILMFIDKDVFNIERQDAPIVV